MLPICSYQATLFKDQHLLLFARNIYKLKDSPDILTMVSLSNHLVCSLIIVICILHTVDAKLRIMRTTVEGSCRESSDLFCLAKDYFDNPTKKKDFCSTRKARCEGSSCERCTCSRSLDTFVSYTHGCMEFQESKKLLLG